MKGLPDFSQPLWFLAAAGIVYGIVMFRYFLIAGIFQWVFYGRHRERWNHKKINTAAYPAGQYRKEIIRSNISGIIFAFAGALMLLGWQQNSIKVYLRTTDYAWWWMPLSLCIALLAQETYYYWLHRWMHIPVIYRRVHQWHHESRIASPWTAFSFHPLEAVIQALFLPLLLLVMPVHLYILVVFLVIMSVSSVVNHLDIEIYPSWLIRHRPGRWLIGATHHALHHKQFKYNYGLYFTWWDHWADTESPVYEKLAEEKSAAQKKGMPEKHA